MSPCISEQLILSKHPPLFSYISRKYSIPILITAIIAGISTAFAQLLGGAIALQILFNVPLSIGAIIILVGVGIFTFTNAYTRIEKIIIAFVSIIGFSFVFELLIVPAEWGPIAKNLFVPTVPHDSIYLILGILGAVVMPHNLYLHSEVIQSRQ